MTPSQRDELLARLDERVGSLHEAVIGNGGPGSSLRERVAKLEARETVRSKLVAEGARTLWLAAVAVATRGLPLPGAHV